MSVRRPSSVVRQHPVRRADVPSVRRPSDVGGMGGARTPPCHHSDPLAVPDHASPERATVAPVLLGPRNCEAATGLPWRHVRDHARELGIDLVRVGRKLAVPASAFLRALQVANDSVAEQQTPTDPAAALRERLGLHLVAANDGQRITNAPISSPFAAETASPDARLPSRKPRKAVG